MLILIISIITITILLYHHFTKYNNYWKQRNVPGPEPAFFFGNIKDLVLKKRAACDIFSEICDQYPEEKVVGIFRMRTPELLIKDLDIIKNILIKDFDNFVDRGAGFSQKGLGANLFYAAPDTWRVLRGRLTPLFTSGKLKNMTHLITELGDKWLDHVDQTIQGQSEQEVHGLAKKFTQSAIAACVFGLDFKSFDDELLQTLKHFEQKVLTDGYNTELEMMYPGILNRIGASPFPKDVSDFFFSLTAAIIAQRDGKPTSRNDFMDTILALRKAEHVKGTKSHHDESERTVEMTDRVIAAQSFIFFVAGNETSTCALGHMLRLLALHPDIQDTVVAELDQVLQNHGGEVTYETIADLKYMEKVWQETIRMYLLTDNLRRCAKTDYKIPGTDITVKKGQIVIIPINVIHHDPKIYPDPEVFDPERFSPENVAARHSCAYLPFGLGPRQCIGSRLARLQVKICAAKFLSKFRVEPSEDTFKQLKYTPRRVFQMPAGGFPLKLVRRE